MLGHDMDVADMSGGNSPTGEPVELAVTQAMGRITHVVPYNTSVDVTSVDSSATSRGCLSQEGKILLLLG